jgi:hypothetical protein
METDKAADPDAFNIHFYENIWHENLFALLTDFHENKFETDRLNYEVITLVTKDADRDKPICRLMHK